MLTTLADAARPGQRRPTPRTVIDLLVGGLRCHFRIPRGAAYLVAAATTAMFVALSTAACVGWLAWSRAAPVPDIRSSLAVAQTAVPLPPSQEPSRYDNPLALNYGEDTGPEWLNQASARV
ncbi:MAG TPA: hypothetical protein DGT23_00675, partial [Micromonosporaceae bacterium]|nr:hypothetical protein [Micromonosporaceae bacterium]